MSTDNAYTAAEVAVVTAQIDGPVAAVNVVDSQQVKRGDIMIVIDDTDARLALRQAEGGSRAYPGTSGRGSVRCRALGNRSASDVRP